MRAKNIKTILVDGVERTTAGLVYNIHKDSKGNFVFDDFGDKLYIPISFFEIL